MSYIWRPHTENILTLKAVKDKKSNFADHIFQRNNLMKTFTMADGGGIELLDLPVCDHCERVAANHDDPPGSAYCWSCGKVTHVPITLREYLMEELKISQVEMDLIEMEIAEAAKPKILI